MDKYNVTLKSELKHGIFYWVTTVKASSEDEAIVTAEHLFLEQINNTTEWNFTDYNAEKL